MAPSPADHDAEAPSTISPSAEVTAAAEKWNEPRYNIARLAATCWVILIRGASDASYGALVPHLIQSYGLPYSFASLIFLTPFVGHIFSASISGSLHRSLGLRGIALLTSFCHLGAYTAIAFRPPYAAFIFVLAVAGFGNGVGDAAWNSWAAGLASSGTLMNWLHASYGLGGFLGPMVATIMTSSAGWPWERFYIFMSALSAVELVATTAAFWADTPTVVASREGQQETTMVTHGNLMHETLFKLPWARVTWLCALFLLGYIGLETSLGGWLVTYMIQVRHGEAFESGMTATGFWLGLAVGRISLGLLSPRWVGKKLAVIFYLTTSIALQLVFWLVPEFVVSALAVAAQGFLLGPIFPAAVVAATCLLPRHLHVKALGFAVGVGSSGAMVLPFMIGAVAQTSGVKVLSPVSLCLLAFMLLVWICLPDFDRKED